MRAHAGGGAGARYRACNRTAAAAAAAAARVRVWGGWRSAGAARRTAGGGVILRRVGAVIVRAERALTLRRQVQLELVKRLEEVRLVAALRRRAARGDARGGVRGGGGGGGVRLGAVVVAAGRDAHLCGGGALHRAPPVLRCAALCCAVLRCA